VSTSQDSKPAATDAADLQRPRPETTDELRALGSLKIAFAVALMFYVVFILRTSFSALGTRYFVLFEDAMISMRYARNFAEGNGLNWNAGEPRVEGYTNLLWTLWMALFHKLGLPESKVSLAIMMTGMAILLTLANVVRSIARTLGANAGVTVIAVVGTLLCYPLTFWTLRGMEVGAVSLLLHTLLLFALQLEDRHSFGRAAVMGVLGALLVLLRSDSALSVGLLGLYCAVTAPRGKKVATLALIGGLVGATVVGHTAFRMKYYEERLPNTAYLKLYKVSFGARLKRGLFVALQVLAFHLPLPLAALLGSTRARLAGSPLMATLKEAIATKASRRVLLCAVLVSLQLAYAVYVGGDAWEWMLYANRYTSAAMPALIVLVAVCTGRLLQEPEVEKRLMGLRGAALTLVGAGFVLLALNAYAYKFPEQGIARTIVVSKKTAAGGALYLLLGGAVFALSSTWASKVEALGAALKTSPRAAYAIALALFLPGQLEPLAFWAKSNAPQYQDEARYARLGLLLARTTPKDFRIAVVAAGATPYFSMRPTEDILGKNDKVIAKEAPRGVFSPGHDKWNYQHSLGARNPDLIVEMADVEDADKRYLDELGFADLGNGLLYRKSGKPFEPALRKSFDTDADLAAALETLGSSVTAP
jgi:hypothetical protein